MKYAYTFQIWPHESVASCSALYEIFRPGYRQEIVKTEEEFNSFRNKLLSHHLTLREIERVPYHNPEGVL